MKSSLVRFKLILYCFTLFTMYGCGIESSEEENPLDPTEPPIPTLPMEPENEKNEDPNQDDGTFTIVNFGDSLTEGPLADTTLGASSFEPSFVESLRAVLPDLQAFLDFATLGTIDKTPEELREIFARPDLVAYSGAAPYSLESRYREQFDVTSMNLAVSGAQISEFDAQFAELQNNISNGTIKNPDLITFGFGSNDYCQQSTDDFKSSYRQALETITNTYPTSKIVIISIPAIHQLFTVAQDSELALRLTKSQIAEIWGVPEFIISTDIELTCGEMREFIQACPASLAPFEQQESNVQAFNQDIAEIVSELNNPNIIPYTASSDPNAVTLDGLAADCFHPNASTHESIADDIWNLINN